MDKFVIRGGKKLSGTASVEGAKNAALPIIAGTLLISKGETIIHNVPPLRDISTIKAVLEHIGAKVAFDREARTMAVSAENLVNNTAPYELMNQMRASFLVLGPVLQRMGEAVISLPGGCSLGPRPVNYHISGFRAMGAEVSERKGNIVAKAKRLSGSYFLFCTEKCLSKSCRQVITGPPVDILSPGPGILVGGAQSIICVVFQPFSSFLICQHHCLSGKSVRKRLQSEPVTCVILRCNCMTNSERRCMF